MIRRLAAALATSLAVATLAAPTVTTLGAQRVNINFAEFASATSRTYPATFGAPLTSKGFDFLQAFPTSGSRNVLGTWGSSDLTATNRPSNRGTSNTMFADQAGIEIDIYVAGDDPFTPTRTFNMYSIDVAHLFATPYVPTLQDFTLQFFGIYADGSDFSQTFTVTAPPPVGGVSTPFLQTLTFDNRWRGVTNVFWNQNGSFLSQQHQFTNVQVEVTPEPGTWALLGTGLAGVLVVARRRRQA